MKKLFIIVVVSGLRFACALVRLTWPNRYVLSFQSQELLAAFLVQPGEYCRFEDLPLHRAHAVDAAIDSAATANSLDREIVASMARSLRTQMLVDKAAAANRRITGSVLQQYEQEPKSLKVRNQ